MVWEINLFFLTFFKYFNILEMIYQVNESANLELINNEVRLGWIDSLLLILIVFIEEKKL